MMNHSTPPASQARCYTLQTAVYARQDGTGPHPDWWQHLEDGQATYAQPFKHGASEVFTDDAAAWIFPTVNPDTGRETWTVDVHESLNIVEIDPATGDMVLKVRSAEFTDLHDALDWCEHSVLAVFHQVRTTAA